MGKKKKGPFWIRPVDLSPGIGPKRKAKMWTEPKIKRQS